MKDVGLAQVSHKYLIEQVQYESKTGGTIDLNFNHPVKELIWTGIRSTDAATAAALNDITDAYVTYCDRRRDLSIKT